MMKSQRGVALIVALIVTLIIGIIAISLGGMAYRTQRSVNASYSNVVSDTNAVSGVNRAISFLTATSGDSNNSTYLEPATSPRSHSTAGWNILGKTNFANLSTTLFNGVDQPMELSGTAYLDYNNGKFWYRDPEGWNPNNNKLCSNCVALNDGKTIYRIEKRGFSKLNPGSAGDAVSVGYTFYRITSRGSDAPMEDNGDAAPGAQSIVQTNFGILGTDSN